MRYPESHSPLHIFPKLYFGAPYYPPKKEVSPNLYGLSAYHLFFEVKPSYPHASDDNPDRPVRRKTVQLLYCLCSSRHSIASKHFVKQVKEAAAGILDHDPVSEMATGSTEYLLISAAICGFARLPAENLFVLDGKAL